MNTSDIVGRLIGQLTSGRWLITIAAMYCLIILVKTLCYLMEMGKITMEASTYVAIVMSVLNAIGMVTVFYFQKNRELSGTADPNATDPNGNGVTDPTMDSAKPPLK